MGSSLGPFLANIIMTEMEKNIRKFIDHKILLFYGGYVNNILVVIKRKHLKLVCGVQNNFDKNFTFTVDAFDNAVPHFLDIEVFIGKTNTGQYTRYNSYSHGTTKHLGFLPLYTELSIFVIKISCKQNLQK